MVTPADDEAMPVQTNSENLDFFVLFLCSHLGTIKLIDLSYNGGIESMDESSQLKG